MDQLVQLIQSSSFYEFAALLALASVGALVGSALRQPLIIAYIVVGVIAGPSVLGIVHEGDEITLLAKMGIAILLFIVGLKLDVKLIKGLGGVAVVVGLGQIALSVGLALLLCLALGLDFKSSALVAVALAFSSTIVIVKLLSDKREIDSIHGRIALGVLIIQDLAVVVAMIVMATVGAGADGAEGGLAAALLKVAGYTAALLVALGLFMRFGAHRVVGYVARNPELLLCFSIAWAIFLAALCDVMGLSKELGGLMAGVSLASTPYREAIISRLSPLRDFLLLFFFVALGIHLDLSVMGGMVVPAIVLSAFVLLSKPVIVLFLSGMVGFKKRTGFLAGVSLAQISEFSLIFMAMTYGLGMVEQDVFGLVTLVGLITITLSTYLMSLSHRLYGVVEPYIGMFERTGSKSREQSFDSSGPRKTYDVIMLGIGRYGQAISEGLGKAGKSVLVVDFNPSEIKRWQDEGGDAVYGDACDPEFYHNLPLGSAQWVVSALPQHGIGITHEDPRLIILRALKDNDYAGKTAVACHHRESADRFYDLGADVVFLPFHDAADRAVNMILEPE